MWSRCWRQLLGPTLFGSPIQASKRRNSVKALCGLKPMNLVIGIYSENGSLENGIFTATGKKVNDVTCNEVMRQLVAGGRLPLLGETRLLYGIDAEYGVLAVSGLGKYCKGYNEAEQLDEDKEAIRIAAGVGARAIQKLGATKLFVESFGHAESAAEGSALGVFVFQEFKDKRNQIDIPVVELYDDCDWTGWQLGLQKAAAQNLARQLEETPSNIMNPMTFAQTAKEVLCKVGINVEVKVRDWAESKGMGCFVAVSKGSCAMPIFMELAYYGTGNMKDRPIVMVGKGTTFDSGGLCLRGKDVNQYGRGEMAGAAVVVATMRAIAAMQLPVNIRGLIPLSENMPGCSAMKPGDTYVAINGMSVKVQSTNCEGRMLMAEALNYGQTFWPKFTLDVGTNTKAVRTLLSTAATGVFSNSDELWKTLRLAAVHTGDRVWRLPLFDFYKHRTQSSSVDLANRAKRNWCWSAETCRCAAFLREFVPCGQWLHLDNFGTNRIVYGDPKYYRYGFSGRPVRTLVEFIAQTVSEDCV